jgi:hypothetical protein
VQDVNTAVSRFCLKMDGHAPQTAPIAIFDSISIFAYSMRH